MYLKHVWKAIKTKAAAGGHKPERGIGEILAPFVTSQIADVQNCMFEHTLSAMQVKMIFWGAHQDARDTSYC